MNILVEKQAMHPGSSVYGTRKSVRGRHESFLLGRKTRVPSRQREARTPQGEEEHV